MNYLKIYNCLIDKRRKYPIIDNNIYTEKHHIIPRSCKGTNDNFNLIKLTAREHYIAHLLLCKIYKNTNNEFSLFNAFMAMRYGSYNTHRRYKCNNRLYEIYKSKYNLLKSKNMGNKNNPMFEKIWIFNPSLKINKIIKKTDIIPDGYFFGRCFSFDDFNTKLNNGMIILDFKNHTFKKKYLNNLCNKKLQLKILKIQVKNEIKKRKLSRKINKIYMMYNWYKKYGLSGVRKQFNYTKSQPCFVKLLNTYVPEYRNGLKHPGIKYNKNNI